MIKRLLKAFINNAQTLHDKFEPEQQVVNPIIVICRHCQTEIDMSDDTTHICTDLETNYNLEK